MQVLSALQHDRGVAQFGRALRSGRRGRKFKSCHADLDEMPETIDFTGFRHLSFCDKAAFLVKILVKNWLRKRSLV